MKYIYIMNCHLIIDSLCKLQSIILFSFLTTIKQTDEISPPAPHAITVFVFSFLREKAGGDSF